MAGRRDRANPRGGGTSRTGRATTISATDAIVPPFALACADPIVLTSDPDDLTALVAEHPEPVTIARV